MTFVFDASALLRYTDNEPGADRVEAILNLAASGSADVLLSAVNWGEIVSTIYKRNSTTAKQIANGLMTLPINVLPVDAFAAEAAGIFKHDYKVPFADAFAGSLTLAHSTGPKAQHATLLTADFDFKNVPKSTMKVEYLPLK